MTENTAAPKASQCLTQPMQEMPAPRANSTFHHIAVSSQGTSLDDAVEPRFGRASGFVLVDIETMQTQYVDNSQAQSMAQGAGIQAAENVANAGANAVLTGRVGPKAKAALDATSLYIGQNYDGMTVRQAVEKFIASIHA